MITGRARDGWTIVGFGCLTVAGILLASAWSSQLQNIPDPFRTPWFNPALVAGMFAGLGTVILFRLITRL